MAALVREALRLLSFGEIVVSATSILYTISDAERYIVSGSSLAALAGIATAMVAAIAEIKCRVNRFIIWCEVNTII